MLQVPDGHLIDRFDSKSQKVYQRRRNQPMEESSPKQLEMRAKSDNNCKPLIEVQIDVQDVSPMGRNQPALSDDSSSVFNSENSIPLSKSPSVNGPEAEKERIRQQRILSALKDEGPAFWSMQNQEIESLPIQSKSVVKNEQYRCRIGPPQSPDQLRKRLITIER